MPVGPLTAQMEQLATLASMSDGKTPEGVSPEATAASAAAASSAAGSHVSGRAVHHVKAFSGKGRTLSSSGSEGGQRATPEDPITHATRVVTQKTINSLRETESRLQQQVSVWRC